MEENKENLTANEEKQPRFVNDTPFTLETLRKAFKHLKIWAFAAITLCALCVLNCLLFGVDNLAVFGGVLMLACCLALVYTYRMNTVGNTQAADNAHHVYKFYEDEIDDVFLYGDEPHGTHRITYSQVTKVFKLAGLLFLQLGSSAYLVSPNGFTQGTEEEFIDFLKEKCNPKVIKIKNKK